MKHTSRLTKQHWLALILSSTLAMTGCNGELEEGEGPNSQVPTDPVDPTNPTEPTDPTDPTDPPQVGTWENKDEDGDGVPDELDDYPFDPSKSSYELVQEEEFNNNQDVATKLNNIPLRVSGAVQQVNDLDFYRLNLESGKSVTILLSSQSDEFSPGMAVLDNNGIAINTWAPNYNPVGRYKRAIQVKPRESGIYYLVINDKLLRGRSDFDYTLDIFFDNDADAINDQIESAFGFESYSQDTDKDGIYDGEEFYAYKYDKVMMHDMDEDGIPNWLDDDSDGDGISDRLEGASDLDEDGYAAFVDLDSDGNLINDEIEVGENISSPQDLDADQIADFIDLDDDNDLILDVNDLEPLAKVQSAPYATEKYKEIREIHYLYDGQVPIKGVMIASKKHRITGEGLTDGLLVFSRESGVPINIPVNVNSDGNIDFILPDDVQKMYFVASNTRTVNEIDIQYRNQYIPILLGQDELRSSPGSSFILKGHNFNEQTAVFVSGVEITPTAITPTEITINIPDSTISGDLYVKNTYGKSNTVKLIINNSVTLNLNAEGLQLDLTKLSAISLGSQIIDSIPFNNNGEAVIPVSNSGYDKISIFRNNDEVLNAIYYGQSEITINYSTTAAAKAWAFSRINADTPIGDYDDLFSQTQQLEEVIKLQNYIEAHITDPQKLNDIDYFKLVAAAGDAVNKLLDTKSIQPSPSKIGSKVRVYPNLEYSKNATNGSPTNGPIITSYWSRAKNTIDLNPTEKLHSIEQLYVYTGNFEISNDTALFLSPEFSYLDIASPTAKPLIAHADSWFSPTMIGPQGWGFLNIAETKSFDHCSYRKCHISIVTPGFSGETLNETEKTAQNYLIARTLVEQFLLPVLDKFISNSGLFKDKQFTGDLLKAIYPYTKAAFDLSNATSNWDRMKIFADLVYKDLTGQGFQQPLSDFLRTRLGNKVLETAGKEVAIWISIKFIPVVGEIDLVLEALGGLNLANQMGQSLHDFIDVPNLVKFDAEWPSVIRRVDPTLLIKDQLPNIQTFKISGYGLGYEDCGWLTCTFQLPEIYLTDARGTDIVVSSKNTTVNSDATEVTIKVGSDELKNAEGELQLQAFIDNINIQAPEKIKFVDKVQLSSVLPNEALPGQKVIIEGVGFIPNKTVITVASKTGRTTADIVSVTNNRIEVILPLDTVTGDVQAEVDGVSSNTLLLTIIQAGITVQFGDNGNITDDKFTVGLNGDAGVAMDREGQRLKEFYRLTEPGEMTITMTANTVPDARGTYYICFSDNVTIIDGPSQSAKDLLTQEDQILSWRVQVNPGSGKVVSQCNYIIHEANGSIAVPILWKE
ncbi:hypothetical protein L1D40_05935 [Shewanella insulae]|uniref:hypothetical protein n=1 Tax=Shewanella insulae TaxID=2681496 RepID=UPI001EFC6B68|nr:hypothetical protein [Shewanella insulae]MCG9754773.1 hypothetical protein [Shewanella insulae]